MSQEIREDRKDQEEAGNNNEEVEGQHAQNQTSKESSSLGIRQNFEWACACLVLLRGYNSEPDQED